MGLSPHGYVNIECLIVGLFALFLPRIAIFLLLFMEMVCGFIYLVCYTYQFSIRSLWAAAPYLSKMPVGQTLLLLAGLALVTLVAAGIAFGLPRPAGRSRIGAAAGLLLLLFLLMLVDIVGGHNPVWPRDDAHALPRLAMSPLVAIGKREMGFRAVAESAHRSGNLRMSSASFKGITFLAHTSTADAPNVMLVLVESWGDLHDAQIADALTAGYRDSRITSRYRVSHGTVPFDGLTVPGEARELCDSHVGFGIFKLSQAQKDDCLPALFHARGYQSVAVHGYIGQMFGRTEWYKAIGMDQSWFGPDLDRIGLPRCEGAFPGTCDRSAAQWIGSALLSQKTGQPKFIYWVTLNSHLPVPENPELPEDHACATSPELEASTSLCSWFRLVSAVHQSVQQLALAEQARPTVFILVGDHAPPFANSHLRQMFSEEDVPYVILTPTTVSP